MKRHELHHRLNTQILEAQRPVPRGVRRAAEMTRVATTHMREGRVRWWRPRSPALPLALLLILTALLLAAGWTAGQEELDTIRQQGYLRVCADASNLPFSSADPATPGFEVELAQRIARELGVDARVQW
jgi:hypothetical protein